MLYLHFCPFCKRIHILSGHRNVCPACDNKLTELSVSYDSYIRCEHKERELLLEQCHNPTSLQKIKSSYVSRYQRK